MTITATVLVPTSIDRGPLLPYTIGSIQRQSVRNIEIFIIGDGVEDVTRGYVRALMDADPRIRFFDHPKHRRRGEPYRHAALQEARGEIVCYMCDRDLMLPNHVATMHRLLQNADFATTLLCDMRASGPVLKPCRDAGNPSDRERLAKSGGYSLSAFAHRLDYYRRMPFGWRETPHGEQTDHYMCRQFLAEPSCRAVSGDTMTVLYFNRGPFPGWPIAKRLPELRHWSEVLQDPTRLEAFLHDALWELLRREHMRNLAVERRFALLVRGQPAGAYLRRKLGQALGRTKV